MKNNLLISLLAISVALLAGLLFLRGDAAYNPYPLFIGEQGRLIDPYLQREVKNTIMANAGAIQTCYNTMIDKIGQNPSLRSDGRLHLDWRVSGRGKPHDVRVIYSELSDQAFQTCVIDTLYGWRFPPAGHSRYVEHTFTFARQRTE